MFPRPIEKSSFFGRFAYKLSLPIVLFLWLLPLLAIFMTSIRPASDIATGNVFGMPSSFQLFQNYGEVFAKTDALRYLLNTLIIAIPTTIISVALACLTGYALAVYKFRWALPLFFLFVAGNFVAGCVLVCQNSFDR